MYSRIIGRGGFFTKLDVVKRRLLRDKRIDQMHDRKTSCMDQHCIHRGLDRNF